MGVPRRQVIAQIARDLEHPSPATVTLPQLEKHIDSLPDEGWIDKDHFRAQLAIQLDGARPYF